MPLLIPLILCSIVVAQQPRVEVTVSSTRIIEGQSFTLEVSSQDGNIQSVSLDNLTDFNILSGPFTSSSYQMINGVVTTTSSYSWRLLATRTGEQVIPSLEVIIGRTVIHTEPVSIEVLSSTSVSAAGNQDTAAPLYLVAEANREETYRGEQITVTWTLYTQLNISGWEIVALPNLTGFWSEELFAPNSLQLQPRNINGRVYRTAVVRRLALFPTRSGELTIDPLILRIGVQVSAQNDPLFRTFPNLRPTQIENRDVISPSISITVFPTPTANRPADYYGVVGQRYSISGALDRQEVIQDEAITLTLTITGEGNFKTLEPPSINFPRGLEVFDPQVSNEPSLGDIVGGTKTLEYVIIPRQSGTLTIPQIRLPYFNPVTEQYELQTTEPFILNVLPRESTEITSSGYSRREVALLGEDIRFIKTDSPRWLKTGESWYTSGMFILNLAAILLFAAPWAGERIRMLTTAMKFDLRARRALIISTDIIDQAKGEPTEIYIEFNQAISQYLNLKLGKNTREYTMDQVRGILSSNGVSSVQQDTIIQILERAAAARFAPVEAGDVEADRQILKSVLSEVEKQWSA